MAQFNWYINKQGLRGHKGDKGDQGFSPYFTEEVNTMNEYKLRVHNEFDSFVTDNLRGNKIQLVNPDGTYVKYDKETGNFYVDSADYATGEIYGQVRLATLADVDIFDSETVLTPDVLSDTLPRYLVNEDGNITITQGSDSKTEIKLGSKLHNVNRIYRNDTERYLTKGDFYHRANPVRKFIPNSDSLAVGYALNYNTSQFKTEIDEAMGNYSLALSNSIASKIASSATQASVNALSSDLDTERTTRLNADNQINSELAAERSERQTQDAALQSQLGTKLTVDNIKAGDNIELVKSGNNVTINSKGGSDLELVEGENIKFTYDKYKTVTYSWLDCEIVSSVNELKNKNFAVFASNLIGNDILFTSVGDYIIVKLPKLRSGDFTSLSINFNNFGSGVLSSKAERLQSPLDESGMEFVGVDPLDEAYFTTSTLENWDYIKITAISKVFGSDALYQTVIQPITGTITVLEPDQSRITINSTGGGAIIDDETVSTDKVFSSSRTSELVGEVGNDLQDLAQRVNDIESLKVPNVVIIGEPMIQNGQVSDLDEQNHLQFPFVIERKGRPFECNFEFTTGANITRQQNVIDSRCSVAVAVRNSNLVYALSTDGTTFNVGERTITSLTLQPYTTYCCKLTGVTNSGIHTYKLSIGLNEADRDSGIYSNAVSTTDPIYPTTMTIGSDGNSFDGVIDLNKWSLKIDNDLVWLGMDNVGQAVSANVSLSNINEAGVKVINDLIDAKLGIIEALVDDINGEVN